MYPQIQKKAEIVDFLKFFLLGKLMYPLGISCQLIHSWSKMTSNYLALTLLMVERFTIIYQELWHIKRKVFFCSIFCPLRNNFSNSLLGIVKKELLNEVSCFLKHIVIRIVNLTSFSHQQNFLAQIIGSFFDTFFCSFFSSPPEQIVVCLDSKVTIT